ncbi:MAG: Gfo/Idh/MocA family oxidoreductase [Fimbriimonadaceae bacterium]|nr:Gfo/Idh/MocA family oxidoreductase [Fimbriimonadaceae bacterium]QYK56267.1 MAG: Gfo/Idh/MocA family oxidoreductase [Fimbriimonadaceae bacterium]
MSARLSRRDFLAVSAATTVTMMANNGFAFVQGSDTIKVGVIGCGGRGTGAAGDAVASSEGVVVTALADLFPDHLKSCAENLKKSLGAKFQVRPDQMFTGWDAYKHLLATDVDVVILAAPPGFRPAHLQAAVDAGKHIFTEKPVAVDPVGARMVYELADKVDEKGLIVVAGTQRRYDPAYREIIRRIHDGAIGEIVAADAYWMQGGLWMHPRQESWSDVEWQLRNWLYFTWLSGDHIVEQHIHNVDVVNWAMNQPPVKAIGMGGRQVRTDPAYGYVYDHFSVEYEYENGTRMQSMCRQQDGTASRVSEFLVGTKGTSNANSWIKGANAFRYSGEPKNPYVEEHRHLIEALRGGKKINDLKHVAEASLTAIMGRLAAYSGEEVTWDEVMASDLSLFPEKLEFGPMEVPSVPNPGQGRMAVLVEDPVTAVK